MFQGFNNDLLSFYAEIRFNNEKAFMDAHRKEYYQKVRDPFYAFIDALAPAMLEIDEDMEVRPHKCLSRINRDTRYTKDKSPYRDHHWVAFRQAARDKDGAPFYWFEIRLDSVSWGLGIWGENPSLLDGLRRRILANPDEVMHAMRVAWEHGFAQGGQVWKKSMQPPASVPEMLKGIYPARSLYFEKQGIDPAWIFDGGIVDRVAADFKALTPVWRLLRGLNDIEGGDL